MIRIIGLLCFTAQLVGCAGSVAMNVNHKDRRDFTVDGYRIAVVPQQDHWSAWFVSESVMSPMPPLPQLKAAEVKAIEAYSGCKVTNAELVPQSMQPAYLQALVACNTTLKQ